MPDTDAAAPTISARAVNTIGQTAIAGGSVTTIADVIDWLFKCHDAHALVTPDQPTSMAMALGVLMIGHSLEKLRLGKARTRATDSPTLAGTPPGGNS